MAGTLSRSDMEAVIRNGGTVLHRHRFIQSVDELPSETDLADGDAERMEAARRRLQTELARAQNELDRLDAMPVKPPPAKPGRKSGGD